MIVRSPSSTITCGSFEPEEEHSQIDAITFILEEPVVGTYNFYMPFGGTIVSTTIKTASGWGTVTTGINSTPVAGILSALSDAIRRTYSASDDNTFVAGDVLYFQVNTNVVPMLYLEVTITYRRTYS